MRKTATKNRTPISGCIVTYNEEDRIADCIESLSFCDEVLVVDSHSEDATRERALGLGARVIERSWPGHIAQKEFAIQAARHPWIVSLDADERISSPLRREILTLQAGGFAGATGYTMPRLSRYDGRWIRHGAWYPNRQLRLFDRRQAHWGGINPHDRVVLNGIPAKLRGHLLHHPYRSRAEQLETIETYTDIAARELLDRGCPLARCRMVCNPVVRVLRSLILKAGVLDGRRGFVLAGMEARYAYLKYAKLVALQREATAERPARVAVPQAIVNTDDIALLAEESASLPCTVVRNEPLVQGAMK